MDDDSDLDEAGFGFQKQKKNSKKYNDYDDDEDDDEDFGFGKKKRRNKNQYNYSNDDNDSGGSDSDGNIRFGRGQKGKRYGKHNKYSSSNSDSDDDGGIKFVQATHLADNDNCSHHHHRTSARDEEENDGEENEGEEDEENDDDENVQKFQESIQRLQGRSKQYTDSNESQSFDHQKQNQTNESHEPSQQQQQQTRQKPVLPNVSVKNLGAWEKHTKGFGSKLLQKFGFTGRLGARETGVSRPIEVALRPAGVGLGFGGLTEAHSLPNNRRVEAEWRGVAFDDKDKEDNSNGSDKEDGDEDGGKKKRKSKEKTSDVEAIASSNSWKKSRKTKQQQQQQMDANGNIRTAAEIIAEQQRNSASTTAGKQVIVDMRYEDVRILTDLSSLHDSAATATTDSRHVKQKPLLGQELLYNINKIADVVEIQFGAVVRKLDNQHSNHAGGNSSVGVNQQIVHTQLELKELQTTIDSNDNKLSSLERFLAVLNKVEKRHSASDATTAIRVKDVSAMMVSVHRAFPEEFSLFGVVHLLPQLVVPLVEVQFCEWDPQSSVGLLQELASDCFELAAYFLEESPQSDLSTHVRNYLGVIVERAILPVFRRFISNEWTDVCDCDWTVACFTLLREIMAPIPFEHLIDMLVLPKLRTATNDWVASPKIPMAHEFLHPWLPLLKAKLSTFYPDLRRKMSTYYKSWNGLDQFGLRMLAPWLPVFDGASFDNLVVRFVLPRLVSVLRSAPLELDRVETASMEGVLMWMNLIPWDHFAALWLGEFFPRWLHQLGLFLCLPSVDLELVSEWYSAWKELFVGLLERDEELTNDKGDVTSHLSIAKPFNAALLMMSIVLDEPEEFHNENVIAVDGRAMEGIVRKLLQRVGYSHVERLSYEGLLEQHLIQVKVNERLQSLHSSKALAGSQPRNISGGVMSMSFKEMLERMALQHGLEFYMRGEMAHLAQGKQLYMFGKCLCYLEQSVVFVHQNHQGGQGSHGEEERWRPVDLEELVKLAT